MRKLGLRGKFLGGLIVSAALPLVVGLAIFETWGYRHLLAERGRLHQVEALTLGKAVGQATEAQGEQFRTWLAADPALMRVLEEKNRGLAGKDPQTVAVESRRLDAQWPSLVPGDPPLQAVLENPGAESLNRYRALHPENAEIFVTDREGRVVASTGRTSDYDQADEAWWQKGKSMPPGSVWTDELNYDDSAKVFSLDVVSPLYEGGEFAGVSKISVDISSLFARLGFDGEAMGERWEIVLPDGRILASSKSNFVSLADRVSPDTLSAIQRQGGTGSLLWACDGDARMTGFVKVGEPGGAARAYFLFSSRRDDVVKPLRRSLLWMGLSVGLLVVVCGAAGYMLIRHQILDPLAVLGKAARSVSATARMAQGADRDEVEAAARHHLAEEDLKKILEIRTGDEIEGLASDLAVMTSRVLRYHRQLEAEVAAKTAVIREDLELAREFQNALLPSDYPEVGPAETGSPLALRFAHFYQPASTIGGDFFDLIELDENRVGVLIADVMGHGARSALITAILRALVRNYCTQATAPGDFLGELNRHLQEVIARSGQTLFVTAFFMTLDTRTGLASWAVAGHPSPLRVRRGSGRAPEPLWKECSRQPALGLLPEAIYRTMESPMKPGDVFLLFTDGVVEAERPDGTPFGVERLAASFDEALDGPMAAMPAKIVSQVSSFQRRAQYDDDVCIVAVEVAAGARAAVAHETASAAREPRGA